MRLAGWVMLFGGILALGCNSASTETEPDDSKPAQQQRRTGKTPRPSKRGVQAFQQDFFAALDRGDWLAAETSSRELIDAHPERPEGHRQLAQLLSSQGRRQESSQHVRQLLRRGQANQRELLSLVDVAGPFQIVSFEEWTAKKPPGLFRLGDARLAYLADRKTDEAFRMLEELRVQFPAQPDVEAFYGRMLAETGRDDLFVRWADDLAVNLEDQAEYWLARGIYFQNQQREDACVSALVRALKIDPTLRAAMRRLATTFSKNDQGQLAAGVQQSLAKLDTVFRKAAQADAQDAFEVGMLLESMLRLREALGWYRYAGRLGGELGAETLAKRVATIQKWESQTSPEKRSLARLRKLIGFDPERFPKADQVALVELDNASEEDQSAATIRFADVASEVGIETSFVSDYNLDKVDFFLHQANGGGLGVIDYDRDGRSDLVVIQSGGDPNIAGSSAPNELYRHFESMSFESVGEAAGCDHRGYGQGVAVADVNQDGWPDVLVANIGRNQLLINRGDGTFQDATQAWLPAGNAWTSSIGVGDLDGDALPDLIEANYVDDPEVFQKKCEGEVLECVPQTFDAARDRFLKLLPTGGFTLEHEMLQAEVKPNYGFGIIVTDFNGDGRNEVFIGNDGDLNHYWQASVDGTGLVEVASVLGNAIGAFGLSEACMGVSSGDFNRDGRCDLAVTNFYREPMNLFMQTSGGSFVDEAMRLGLDVPSRMLLGFGCQSSDFDNDGWLDLTVLNGHLYDFRQNEIPFRMPPQFFRGSRTGFEVLEMSSPFFQEKRLGRTLAVADLDGDGRVDQIANHLDAPVSILRNESESGNWIGIDLVGRISDRDGTGARVLIECGEESYWRWQTGGDGYMCSNQSMIHCGIGQAASVDRVTVFWPSGEQTTVNSPGINRVHRLFE